MRSERSRERIVELTKMLSSLTRNWWLTALRGVVAILFGAAAFAWPDRTFDVLVLLFGAYALIDGTVVLAYGLLAASYNTRLWSLVAAGFIGVATGVLTFMYTSTVGQVLVYVIVAWAIVTGALQIAAAIRLRTLISDEWLIGLSGALSILFGALIVARPNDGAVALVYLFGVYAILLGVSLVGLGFRLRNLGAEIRSASTQTVPSTSRS
jgi:uncharacterized membrane protein HdeD (DUF308 family)